MRKLNQLYKPNTRTVHLQLSGYELVQRIG